MASLFDTLQANAFRSGITARTTDSRKWFQSKIADMTMPSRQKLLKDPALEKTNRDVVGNMYMYFYDPKHKKTLPYYDRFPLTIMVQPAEGGFHGLNLHYLPINLRVRLLDRLVDLTNNTKFDSTTRISADYARLKNVRLIRPTIKRYLNGRVKSQFRRIDADEFTAATLLPVARFKKESVGTVWADSRKMI